MSDPWLTAPPRLAGLGFTYDPFGAMDAEELDFDTLNETFVEPDPGGASGPALEQSIYTYVRAPARSVAVIASPGAGKTALRRMVVAWLRSATPAVCVARLTGLEGLVAQQAAPTLADYGRPILASVTSAVTEALLRGPVPFLSLDARAQSWWWSFLLSYPAAQTLESQLPEGPLQASFAARADLGAPFTPGADVSEVLAHVRARLAELGFDRLVLVVDGVDYLVDTAQADDGAADLARLLGPLLRAQGFFRIRGVAWKLFLPTSLGPAIAAAAPVRDGWLQVRPLSWTPAGLDALLAKRLEWASDGAYTSLEPISETDLALSERPRGEAGSPLHQRLAALVLARPERGPVRALLRLAGELFATGAGLLTRAEWDDLLGRHQLAPAPAAPGRSEPQSSGAPADEPGLPPICGLTIGLELGRKVVSVTAMTFLHHDSNQPEELLLRRVKTRLRFQDPALLERSHDALEYGPALTERFFAPPEVLNAFASAYSRAVGAGARLRVRLAIPDEAAPLHSFRWELLQRPFAPVPTFLCLDERILFSRHLPMRGGEGGPRRPRGALEPLVAIASPPQPNRYNLEALPADQLLGELEQALAGGSLTRLLNVSLASLDYHHADVMMLICHGRMVDGSPQLYLHGEDGAVHPVRGADLISYVANRARKPTFWILASCQGAGRGADDQHALSALGPQLSRVGVGAVLAFADNVQIAAICLGLPRLVEHLRSHGQIELAVAAMRRYLALRTEAWWQSVIYLGLDDGLLWRQDGPARR